MTVATTVTNNGKEFVFTIPVELVIFLVSLSLFCSFLFVFYSFLNRRFRTQTTGKHQCCGEPLNNPQEQTEDQRTFIDPLDEAHEPLVTRSPSRFGTRQRPSIYWSPLHNAFRYTYTGSGFTLDDIDSESDEDDERGGQRLDFGHLTRGVGSLRSPSAYGHPLLTCPSPPVPSTPSCSPKRRASTSLVTDAEKPFGSMHLLPGSSSNRPWKSLSIPSPLSASSTVLIHDMPSTEEGQRLEPASSSSPDLVAGSGGNVFICRADVVQSQRTPVNQHPPFPPSEGGSIVSPLRGPAPREPAIATSVHGDLISLAEKGRVGLVSACSSSSGDDESSQKSLRHRFRRCRSADEPSSTPRSQALMAIIDTEDPILDLGAEASYRMMSGDFICGAGNDGVAAGADASGTSLGPSSKCGSLEVAFSYDALSGRMSLAIIQARDVPPRAKSTGECLSQVRILLLPSRKQRHRTRILPGDNPMFHETFIFSGIHPEEVNSMGVRLRLYGCERLRRERLIGETVVGFASVNLDIVAPMWLTLEAKLGALPSDVRSEVSSVAHSESTGSSQSRESYSGAGSASGSSTCRRSSRGSRASSSSYAGSSCIGLSGVRLRGGMAELLIGLTYKPTTGRLSVDVLRGSHFRNLTATRSPDTYVCLSLISSSGQEISSSRTSVRRAQANPVYKETFVYQVPLFQVGDVTLMVTVLTKKGIKRKEMIGWFALGMNSSGEEELAHWNEMRESPGEEVIRWHILLDS